LTGAGVNEIAQGLAGFQQRFDAARGGGRVALDAAWAGVDEETVSHLDWAGGYLARFRLRVLDGEKLPGERGHFRPASTVGTVDEGDPSRAPFVAALKELGRTSTQASV